MMLRRRMLRVDLSNEFEINVCMYPGNAEQVDFFLVITESFTERRYL